MRLAFLQTADAFVYKDILDASARANIEFCKRHAIAYESYCGVKVGAAPWMATYNRIFMLNELMERGYSDWVIFADSDAFVADLKFDIRSYITQNEGYCLIGATGGSTTPWDINAGVLFINFGDNVGRHFVSEWKRQFTVQVPHDYLNNASAIWGDYPNDQILMHDCIKESPALLRKTKKEEALLFDYQDGTFIRQAKRTVFPDLSDRTAWVRDQVSRALGELAPNEVLVNLLTMPSPQGGSDAPPSTPTLVRMEYVLGLLQQSDWNNALEVWDTVAWKPWLDMARELRALGRRDEADRVLHKLTDRFPGEAEPALEYASMAYAEQNWAEAITRFETFRQRFPDSVIGYRYVGDLLFGQRRFDEADAVIQEGMARFPDEMELAVSYAWSAHLKGDQISDWREACKRWKLLVSLFPDNPLGASMQGFVLTRYLGQPETAEIILSGAIVRFPDDIGCAMQYARAADYRGDWDEAMRRWNAFAARWPDSRAIKEGRGETEARQHFHKIETSSVTSDGPSQTRVAPEADILLKFESLGENCEFGLVQRHYGAEPLDLLRWMGAEADQLCSALEAGFDGLDAHDNLEIELRNSEYFLRDRRYQMEMHTFIMHSEYHGTLADLQHRFARRMRYLKNKLISDLCSAEKIFVWQSGVGSTLSDATVVRMHQALQAYGNNTLLVMRRHNNASEAPLVEAKRLGLLVGTIHQIESVPGDDGAPEQMSAPFQSWLTVCKIALKLRTEMRRGAIMPVGHKVTAAE